MVQAANCTICVLLALAVTASFSTAHNGDDNVAPGLQLSELKGLSRGHTGAAAQKLRQYLAHYGHLAHVNHDVDVGETFDDELAEALKSFEQFHGLPLSDQALNNETIDKILAPRCGLPDIMRHGAANSRFLFDAKYGKWSKTRLTWAIDTSQMTKDMALADIVAQTRAAFAEWARVTPLTFSQATDLASADVKIRFRVGDHGDGAPFSQPNFNGMTAAAHAFFPPNGELHLNGLFTWNVNSYAGLDLQTIILHELGHSLGLGHTTVRTAVMYPTVTANVMHRILDADDINGIQSLYGGRATPTTGVPPPVVPRPAPKAAPPLLLPKKPPPPRKRPPPRRSSPPPPVSPPWWEWWKLYQLYQLSRYQKESSATETPLVVHRSSRHRRSRHRKVIEVSGDDLNSVQFWRPLLEGFFPAGGAARHDVALARKVLRGEHGAVSTLTGKGDMWSRIEGFFTPMSAQDQASTLKGSGN